MSEIETFGIALKMAEGTLMSNLIRTSKIIKHHPLITGAIAMHKLWSKLNKPIRECCNGNN